MSDPATSQPPATEKYCVIANAGAGKGGAGVGLDDLLDLHPDRFVLRRVAKGSELESEAGKAIVDGFETVIGAGGDGTLNAVANAVAGTPATLGVIPLGTFNYFARSLGLPEEPDAAVALVAGPQVTQTVDAATINERLFLNNASLGLYPAVLQQRERTYKKWGRSRILALWAVMRTLWRFQIGFRMKIVMDGQYIRLRTPSAFIACNPYQLRSVNLEGADHIEAGKLALIVAPDCGRFQLMLNFVRLGMGLAQRGREFELYSGAEIVVETRRRNNLIAIDGERVRMKGPFRFRIRPGALRVLAPAPKAGEA